MATNTVVTDTISEEVKLRIAKKIVFKSYIARLTRDVVDHEQKMQLSKINKINPSLFHIWTTKRIPGIENKIDTTWYRLFDKYDNKALPDNFPMPVHIGTFKNTKVLTVNNDTNAESEISKEEIYNIPASSWIFSTAYSGESYVRDDWQYDRYEYNPMNFINSTTTVSDWLSPNASQPAYGKVKGEKFDTDYWHDSYDFTSAFDSVEYKIFDINKTILPENKAVFNTTDNEYEMTKYSSKVEAILITYGNYDNIELTPYNSMTYKYFQPVVYCELHNPVAYMKGTVTFQWSQNGIISIN